MLSMFRKLWQPSRRPRTVSVHPQLEALERRYVPSTIFNVSNGADGTTAFLPVTYGGTIAVQNLRQAISDVNHDPTTGADTIELTSGTYALTQASLGELSLTSTAHKIVIEGQGSTGPNATIIDASALNDRVFQIAAGVTVEFEKLEITGGTAENDGSGGTAVVRGGGILNLGGKLTLDNVLLTGNQALGSEVVSLLNLPVAAQGGGLYSSGGTVKILNSTVSDNSAKGAEGGPGEGGGLFVAKGTVTLTSDNILNNLAQGGRGAPAAELDVGVYSTGGVGGAGMGGGLYLHGGKIVVSQTVINGNTAQGGDGSDGSAGGNGGVGKGGAIYAARGTLTLSDDPVTYNFALGGNGGSSLPASSGLRSGNPGKGGAAQDGGVFIAAAAHVTENQDGFLGNSAQAGSAGTRLGSKGQTDSDPTGGNGAWNQGPPV